MVAVASDTGHSGEDAPDGAPGRLLEPTPDGGFEVERIVPPAESAIPSTRVRSDGLHRFEVVASGRPAATKTGSLTGDVARGRPPGGDGSMHRGAAP